MFKKIKSWFCKDEIPKEPCWVVPTTMGWAVNMYEKDPFYTKDNKKYILKETYDVTSQMNFIFIKEYEKQYKNMKKKIWDDIRLYMDNLKAGEFTGYEEELK